MFQTWRARLRLTLTDVTRWFESHDNLNQLDCPEHSASLVMTLGHMHISRPSVVNIWPILKAFAMFFYALRFWLVWVKWALKIWVHAHLKHWMAQCVLWHQCKSRSWSKSWYPHPSIFHIYVEHFFRRFRRSSACQVDTMKFGRPNEIASCHVGFTPATLSCKGNECLQQYYLGDWWLPLTSEFKKLAVWRKDLYAPSLIDNDLSSLLVSVLKFTIVSIFRTVSWFSGSERLCPARTFQL